MILPAFPAGYNSTVRILVIGCSGSGKTTLARRLARELGITHYSLDYLFWKPGWVESPDSEFIPRVEAACAGEDWVMDGGYSRTISIRLARADTVIWLDVTRSACLARVMKRFLLNVGRVRQEMPPGCVERLDLEFLRWIWNWHRTHHGRFTTILSDWLGQPIGPGWTVSADGARRVWQGRAWPRANAELSAATSPRP